MTDFDILTLITIDYRDADTDESIERGTALGALWDRDEPVTAHASRVAGYIVMEPKPDDQLTVRGVGVQTRRQFAAFVAAALQVFENVLLVLREGSRQAHVRLSQEELVDVLELGRSDLSLHAGRFTITVEQPTETPD